MKILYKLYFLLVMISFGVLYSGDVRAQGNEKTIISNQDKTITVYPIPASTSVNIRLSAALRAEVDKIEIVNLIGRKMAETPIIDRNTLDITFTNLGEMPQGIYMVITRDKYGKIIQSAKMVINR